MKKGSFVLIYGRAKPAVRQGGKATGLKRSRAALKKGGSAICFPDFIYSNLFLLFQ